MNPTSCYQASCYQASYYPTSCFQATGAYNKHLAGAVSLTEMLMAIMLLSLVTAFAFAAITTMQRNTLVEAKLASDRITTTEALRDLARQFYDNPDLSRTAPASFPAQDSRLTILGLRRHQSLYDSAGGVKCTLADIDLDAKSAVMPATCLAAYQLTPNDIISSFGYIALPVIFPEWAAEPCLITRLEPYDQAVRFYVENTACLMPGSDAGNPVDQSFHLPQLIVVLHNRRHRQDMIMMASAGGDHHIPRPRFNRHQISSDGIWIEMISQRPQDNFANQPVNIFQFSGRSWIYPPLITSSNHLELHIESLTDNTIIMADCGQAGQQNLHLGGLSSEQLELALYALCFQHSGSQSAELMMTIRSGNSRSQWRHGIRFRHNP